MWICADCGEPNFANPKPGTPDDCAACGRPRRGLEPTRWEPRNAPGFRDGPTPAPRNAPPLGARHREPRRAEQGKARAAWYQPPEPEPLWIPEAADASEPAPKRRLLPAVPILVLVGALAAAAILGGPRLLDTGSTGGTGRAATPGAAAPPTAAATPPLESTREPETKLVTVGGGVTHERAPAVAAMLEIYFTGINEKDYAQVAEVMDPAGELDPDNPEQMARFTDGTATAKDSDVVLHELTDLGSGRLGADVTFRSVQEPGDGPDGRPAETCTDWRVSYTITTGEKYRILNGEGTSAPC